MKLALLGTIASFILPIMSARAANAYDAMRIIGQQKGEAILEKITEVRGSKGTPQPSVWKISTANSSYDVRASKIISTSAGRALSPLNLSELKLDSDGAHTVAEREAKKQGFEYDYADYSLRTGTKSTPVWEVRLVDDRSRRAATLNIGADTGKIISILGMKGGSGPTAPIANIPDRPADGPVSKPNKTGYVKQDPADYDPADEPAPKLRPAPPRPIEDEEEGDPILQEGEYQNPRFERVMDKVSGHIKLRGRQFHSWFDRNVRPGGTPTYSPNNSRNSSYEEDRPAPRRTESRTTKPGPNETRYYRPDTSERLRD